MSKEKVKLKKKDKLAEMEAQWKRALADYQNLTKEMANERIRMRTDAVRDVALSILPILDNFASATDSEPETDDAKVKNWVAGVGFVRKQMEDMLTEFGVKKIESVGKPFDPETMEAVGEESPSSKEGAGGVTPGTVLKETCAGYTLGDTTLRPAKVIISK